MHENRRIAAIGGYGTFAADAAKMMRLNSYHVLHLSPEGATISQSDHAELSACLNKLQTTHSETICEDVATVSVFLQCYGVNEVNFFYSDNDFTQFRGSRHIGATLRCYVAVLQATVGKNIALKLFLYDARISPETGITWPDIHNYNMMKDFKTVQYGSEKHRSKRNGEEPEMMLHDVLFHSLRSYLEMYRKLYRLQVTVFVN